MAKCNVCGKTFTTATAPCGHTVPFRPIGAVKLVKRTSKAKSSKKK